MQNRLKIKLEIIWWLITILIVAIVLFPIYNNIRKLFPFYIQNITSIIVFLTLGRWIFQLKYTVFGWSKKWKLAILFLMIPLFFVIVQNIIDYQYYVNENGISLMLTNLSYEQQNWLAKYINSEYLFFATGSLICIVITPIRMLKSIWMQVNKGKI